MKHFKNILPNFLCYLIAFVLGMKQLREPDIWWQLLSGRWMLEQGQITHSDVFSYTMTGQPWINVKWLYEIAIALIEKAVGPQGVSLLQSIINVLIVYLIFCSLKMIGRYTQQPISNFFAVISALLFLAISEFRMIGRPEMISHFMCALYLFLLLKYPKLEWKNVIWLLPLQCLWANMHEGYPIGLVTIGAFLFGNIFVFVIKRDQTSKQQSIIALLLFTATCFALLINPNGIQLWKQPFEIYRQVWANKYTSELFSYDNPKYWTIQAKLHLTLLSTAILFWIIKIRGSLKNKANFVLFTPVVASYIILIFLFGYLSLTANRNIPFAQIILFPSIPLMLKTLVKKSKISTLAIYARIQQHSTWIATGLSVLFYINIVNNKFYKITNSANRYGLHVSMLHNPIGASGFIKEHKITGTVFSDYFVSSYLLWSLYPNFHSYIDLRDLDLFPVSFFDRYFELYNQPEKFKEIDKKYNFNYAVISTSQLVGLQIKLYWQNGYNLVYADPVTAIFLKQNDFNKPINDNIQIQKLFTWPKIPTDPKWCNLLSKVFNPFNNYSLEDEIHSPVYAAAFYNQVQNYPLAIHLLLPKLSTLHKDIDAYNTLATIYMNYAKTTNDPQLQQQRIDTANIFIRQSENLKAK